LASLTSQLHGAFFRLTFFLQATTETVGIPAGALAVWFGGITSACYLNPPVQLVAPGDGSTASQAFGPNSIVASNIYDNRMAQSLAGIFTFIVDLTSLPPSSLPFTLQVSLEPQIGGIYTQPNAGSGIPFSAITLTPGSKTVVNLDPFNPSNPRA
jgi:hypothetical protein